MHDAAYCVCRNAIQAHRIVDDLRATGFPSSEISTLFPNGNGITAVGGLGKTDAPVKGVFGAGGAPDGALGWLAGVKPLEIPGVGGFLAAGPFLGVLSEPAVRAAGLSGALVGIGVASDAARAYEAQLKSGCILLSVQVDDEREGDHAREIFVHRGATHVSFGSRGQAASLPLAPRGTQLAAL